MPTADIQTTDKPQTDHRFKRLLLLGAAGRVGRSLLSQAVDSGYDVTVLVRNAARLPDDIGTSATVLEGDASRRADIERALDTRPDAVLSTLGKYVRQPETPMSDITEVLVAAMEQKAIRRLVLMSSLGVGESRRWGGLIEQYVVRVVLRHVLADKARQEAILRASQLDWTILRPPRILEHDDKSAVCRRWQEREGKQRVRWAVSRQQAAAEMLRLLEDDTTIGQTWHIAR